MNAQEVALVSELLALVTTAILKIPQLRQQAQDNNDQDALTNLASAHNNFNQVVANAKAVIGA